MFPAEAKQQRRGGAPAWFGAKQGFVRLGGHPGGRPRALGRTGRRRGQLRRESPQGRVSARRGAPSSKRNIGI